MNCYNVRFTGRRKGAIGIFYEIEASVFAPDEAGAVLALYERFEHVSNPEVKLWASPFDADGIVIAAQNDQAKYDETRRIARQLAKMIDSLANEMAEENAKWHDDEESSDWSLYHAPADQQYPQAERTKAALELIARHLEIVQEEKGVA